MLNEFETRITGYFLHLLREWRYFKINEYCRVYSLLIAVMNSLNYHLLHVTLLYLPAFYDTTVMTNTSAGEAKTLYLSRAVKHIHGDYILLTSILNIYIIQYYSLLQSIIKCWVTCIPIRGRTKLCLFLAPEGNSSTANRAKMYIYLCSNVTLVVLVNGRKTTTMLQYFLYKSSNYSTTIFTTPTPYITT